MDSNIASLAQGQFASPGLQYLTNPYQVSTYPYQVPDGHGALAAYYAALQPWGTQGWFGNLFGYPQLGGIQGGWGGQLPNPQMIQQPGGAFGQQALGLGGCNAGPQQLASQGWLGNLIGQSGQQLGFGLGGAFGNPQFGSYLGLGSQQFSSPQAIQTIQHATQQAAQLAQQVAQQAAQQAGQQVGVQAALTAQQAAQQVAQQGAQQVAQQAAQIAQQVAHQAAQQAAQQVGLQATLIAQQAALQVAQQAAHQAAQQAAQVAQQAAYQAAQHIVAGCLGQQAYSPLNALGAPYGTPQPWGTQGGYGNYVGQLQQPFGINLGGTFGYPQLGGGVGGFGGQMPWNPFQYLTIPQPGLQSGFGMFPPGLRALNPFAGAPLGAQTPLAPTPRFSFA